MVKVNKSVAGSQGARTVTRDHHEAGSIVPDTVQEKIELLRAAADCARELRDSLPQVDRGFVREQPLKSMLIAAGVGLVLGRFWLRR